MILLLANLWSSVRVAPALWWALWIGLALLTISLVLLMRTRWGQSEPLGKCLALSLLAHLLMAGYATTVQIVHTTQMMVAEHRVKLADLGGTEPIGDQSGSTGNSPTSQTRAPWELADQEAVLTGEVISPQPEQPRATETVAESPIAEQEERLLQRGPLSDLPKNTTPIDAASAEHLVEQARPESKLPAELKTPIETSSPQQQTSDPIDAPKIDIPQPERIATEPGSPLASPVESVGNSGHKKSAQISANLGELSDRGDRLVDADVAATGPAANQTDSQSIEAPPPILPDDLLTSDSAKLTEIIKPSPATLTRKPSLDPANDPAPPIIIPKPYRQRVSDRLETATKNGGSKETEIAVDAALKWLANHQSESGGWDATRHGAGQEKRVGGEDRRGAGAGADTGISGLALLAMLGAGHTQLNGEHQECVRRGLEYLIASQAADGNLGGRANLFAKMYCHAMATIALGEAYGLSADNRLRGPLQKAINYTLKSQDPKTGGWRYQPADPGDTSQLGWQLMALRSAELAGLSIPQSAKSGMTRFLKSVSSGKSGGLASYRPEDRATRSMTAEALVCREFLGLPVDAPMAREAADFVVQELPGSGQSNLYYWYYATLCLYQLGGDDWQRWNSALKGALLAEQKHDGDEAGSWDTNDLWGGNGGRVYTTAMGALCLEVYYRYLPLYGHPIARELNGNSLR